MTGHPRAAAVSALLQSLASRDPYTADHGEQVAMLALKLAEALQLPLGTCERTWHAAMLHDIGKIGVDPTILNKPAKLNPTEFRAVQRHSAIGARMLAQRPELADLAPLVRAVHERFDGHGYPDGISGHDIPIESRVIAICDAWHAMISDRVYRAALTHSEAIAELEVNAGSQFDPELVEAFLTIVEE